MLDSKNTKIGPILEAATCCLQGADGMENRIDESMNKDLSCSWLRISHSLNKLVTDLNNKNQNDNEQERPRRLTRGEWDRMAEKIMLEFWRNVTPHVPCHKSNSPEVNSQKK